MNKITNRSVLTAAFESLQTYQIIRIQAHTEAWGVTSPHLGWTSDLDRKG